MPPDPACTPENPDPSRAKDLSLWLVGVALLLCLAVGLGVIWWYARARPAPDVITISVSEQTTIPDAETPPQQPPVLPRATLPATNVSFELQSASAAKAFATLAKAAHIRITLDGHPADPAAPPITTVYKDQSFWSVLLDLADKTGYWPVAYPSADQIIHLNTNAPPLRGPCALQGPFLFCLNQVLHTQVRDLGGGPASQTIRISGRLYWEPSHRIRSVSANAIITEATDTEGHDLRSTESHNYFSMVQGAAQVNVWIPLACPPAPGQHIAHLAGYFRVTTQGEKDTVVEIPHPLAARGRQITVEGFPVELTALERTEQGYTAQFVVQQSFRDPRVFRRFQSRTIRLLDEQGNEFRRHGGGTSAAADDFSFYAQFTPTSPGQTPAKLILTVPSDLKEARIPFDFKDLPLP